MDFMALLKAIGLALAAFTVSGLFTGWIIYWVAYSTLLGLGMALSPIVLVVIWCFYIVNKE